MYHHVQRAALATPLIGRGDERVQIWTEPPFAFGLSFNR